LPALLVEPVAPSVGRYRNTIVSLAKALRFELPARGAPELYERDPEVIAFGPGSIDGCFLVSGEDGLRHQILLVVSRRSLLP
jgi:hypothetical protein